MNQTLDGIKVVELAQYISGPYCGMLLAGLGAQLTKIEEPAAGDISRRCGPFPKDNPHTDIGRAVDENRRTCGWRYIPALRPVSQRQSPY
ncbi:MAG: CoA transferase [Deltaproteobacteria bacterium]|nr:CoA transferase [Deltaproteobacteria bacterium]